MSHEPMENGRAGHGAAPTLHAAAMPMLFTASADQGLLFRAVLGLQHSVGELTGQVGSLAKTVEDTARYVGRLEERMTANLLSLDKRWTSNMEKLEERLSTNMQKLEERISTNMQKLEEQQNTNMLKLEERISTNMLRLEERLSGSMSQVEQRMSRIERTVSGVTHMLAGATAVIAIVVTSGGFLVNKAWDAMASRITVMESVAVTPSASTFHH